MSDAVTTANTVSTEVVVTPPTRARKILSWTGWVAFALGCLIVFTVIKLPELRLKNYIQGQLANQLAERGITFTAGKSSVSMFLGVSYTMRDVTLNFPPPTPPAHIDQIEVSPSLIGMIVGRMGGKVWLYDGDGSLKASFSLKQTKTGAEVSTSFKAKKLDLGKVGLLPILTGINGGMILSGEGSVAGDTSVPSSLNGTVKIDLSKVTLPAQSIQGFSVPRLAISEGTLELVLGQGKAQVKTFKLGKAGDDIAATVSGDVLLGKQWESSTLNLKTQFRFSEGVMKSFVLIDALLSAGKQADGGYAYNLAGPLTSPQPTPVGAGK